MLRNKARQHGVYVTASFIYRDNRASRICNLVPLFDRKGKRIGRYFKNHPWTVEILDSGITPGTEVPVFQADFGGAGMMICYDSRFADVSQLLALKGAEIQCDAD